MNKRASAWIVAAVLVAVPLAAPMHAASAWLQYVHPRLGFSFTYPGDWIVGPKISGIEVMVLSPSPVTNGGVRLNVNVVSESLPPGVTIERYEAANESQLRLLFHGYKRLRTDRTMVGEHVAWLRYFTWTRNDGVDLYQMQLVTIAGTQGYVVTGTTGASSPHLQTEVQLLANILASFRPK